MSIIYSQPIVEQQQRNFGKDITNLQQYISQTEIKFQHTSDKTKIIVENSQQSGDNNSIYCKIPLSQSHSENSSEFSTCGSESPRQKLVQQISNSVEQEQKAVFSIQESDSCQIEQFKNTHDIFLKHDPQQTGQYCDQILSYMRQQERKYIPQNNKILLVRSNLVDWMIDLQCKLNLKCDTLFQAVNMFDRFIDVTSCQNNEICLPSIQLIAGTCMFIAAKCEEIYPPSLADFASKIKTGKNEILKVEGAIIQALQFDFTQPTSLKFFEAYNLYQDLDPMQINLALFLLQLSLYDPKQVTVQPSKIAAAAILVTKKLKDMTLINFWSKELEIITGYGQQELEDLGNLQYFLLLQVQSSPNSSVFQKFSQNKFGKIALRYETPKQI